jgi:quinolinate synthase
VRALRARFPDVPVAAYINTYAEVKAESDVICTSGNAARVVSALEADTVIFLPDEYLARNVAQETGKRILVLSAGSGKAEARDAGSPPPGLLGWPGRCEVHEKFTVEDVRSARAQFSDVLVLAHPECSPEVVAAADFAGSTSAMNRFVREHPGHPYLLLTECSMGDNIAAENPERELVRLCSVRCPHMNEITLEETLASLAQDRYRVEVPEEVRLRARRALDRMLSLS